MFLFDKCAYPCCEISVKKRKAFMPRRKMFIGMAELKRVMIHAKWRPQWDQTALWMITAYAFLARVP